MLEMGIFVYIIWKNLNQKINMKGYYITVSNGLLDVKHRERMGSAVWEFMFLLDKMTSCNENGIGKVLGGKPIKMKELSELMGVSKKTVSRNLRRLSKQGYIEMIRTPYGYSFKIFKAKKIFQNNNKRPDKSVQSDDRDQTKVSSPKRVDKSVRNKEDKTALDNTIDDKTTSNKVALNPLIELFSEVNPTYEKIFRNKTERKSLEDLVKKFGEEKIKQIIEVLPMTNKQQYAPTITTPYQLEKNLGKLKSFFDKQRSSTKGKKIIISNAL